MGDPLIDKDHPTGYAVFGAMCRRFCC